MRCEYSKNGGLCRAHATHDSKYCFWHNPDMKVKMEEARRKGGLNRRKPTVSHDEFEDIQKAQDIKRVRTGKHFNGRYKYGEQCI